MIRLRRKICSERSTLRFSKAVESSFMRRPISQRPAMYIARARTIFRPTQILSETRFVRTFSKSILAIFSTVSANLAFCMLSGTMSFSVCCAVMKRNPMKELNLIG